MYSAPLDEQAKGTFESSLEIFNARVWVSGVLGHHLAVSKASTEIDLIHDGLAKTFSTLLQLFVVDRQQGKVSFDSFSFSFADILQV